MINEKIREWIDTLMETLNEQEFVQELKAKWEELDHQSQNYFKLAGFGSSILLLMFIVFSFIWSVHSLKTELSEKRNLLSVIQAANNEMQRLRNLTPNLGVGGGKEHDSGSWTSYFEAIASSSGLDKVNLSISPETAGASGEQTKEVLFDVNLKHVNIKQVVRYAFSLENGKRPVKLRNLLIDTKGDPSGYLDATLALSAFIQVEPK